MRKLKLTGPQWLDRYKRRRETRYDALSRMSRESGLGLKTIYRACVYQLRITPESLAALEKLSGDSVLDRESFLDAPTGRTAAPERLQKAG